MKGSLAKAKIAVIIPLGARRDSCSSKNNVAEAQNEEISRVAITLSEDHIGMDITLPSPPLRR